MDLFLFFFFYKVYPSGFALNPSLGLLEVKERDRHNILFSGNEVTLWLGVQFQLSL